MIIIDLQLVMFCVVSVLFVVEEEILPVCRFNS